MKLLHPGENGQAYVTENVGGIDYLLGASEGAVYQIANTTTNTDGKRIVPTESSNSLISSSYSWLIDNGHGTTSTTLATEEVTFKGEPLSGTAIVSMSNYSDKTGEIQWMLIVVIPVDDYYEFVKPSVIFSIASSVGVCCYFPAAMLFFAFCGSLSSPKETVSKQLALCLFVGLGLWVWW